ncbi:MAG TPA: hypothetical protein VGL06_19040 [Pseudonocardiaceae bacterium]
MDDRYSEAGRCAPCDGRAALSEAAAARFVAVTDGRLVTFQCPDGNGWHLFNPTAERGRSSRS